MNAAGDFRWKPTSLWPDHGGGPYGAFMDAIREIHIWREKDDPRYIKELPYITNVRLRQFKENYRGMSAE